MMPENEIINDPIVLDTQNTEIIEVDVLEVTPSTGSADVLNHANLNNRDSTDAHPMSAITGLTEALDDIEAAHSVHVQAAQESIEEVFETLDEHTTQISTMGANINFLAQKVGANETNVVSAIYVANQAYNKAQEALESTSISEEAIRDALENILESEERIDAFESIIESSAETSAQAKAIAEGAVSSANAIKEEAVQRANEAFAIAEDVQSEAHSLCAKIDQYSVGEYSQAYGLTKDQADRILVPGMIYVPTAHPATQYHQEEYDGSEETKYVRWFTPGYLYRWGLIDTNKYGWLTIGNDTSPSTPEDYSDPDTAVAPVVEPCVYFATIEPEIDPSNVYNYWYTNGNTVSPETYAPYTLYERQGDAWVAVATLMGNASNRMTSEIYQSTNRITLDVANAQGSIAAFDARLEETESTITSLAEWQHGGEVSKAIIRQHSEDGNASIVISTIQQDGENVAEASMVLTSSKNDGSALVMSADNIDFEAGDFTINADHINLNGAVTANNNVTISEDGKITAVEANISGTITATGGNFSNCTIDDTCTINGKLIATEIDVEDLSALGATIGGWYIDDDGILSDRYVNDSGEPNSNTTISGMMSHKTTPSITIGDKTIQVDAYYDGLVTNRQSPIRFLAGSTPANVEGSDDIRLDDAKFMVLDDGSMYASACQLRGSKSVIDLSSNGLTITSADLQNMQSEISAAGLYTYVQDGQSTDIPFSMFFGALDTDIQSINPELLTGRGMTIDENGQVWLIGKGITALGGGETIDLQADCVSLNCIDVAYIGGLKEVQITSQGKITIGNGMYSGVEQWLLGTWLLNGAEAVTSDKNLKHDITSLDDKYMLLFDQLQPVKFKYNDGMSDRYHTGFIAQDVGEAVKTAGLDTNDFAAYVKFTNTDDKGESHDEYALRYSEFVALNTWQIQKAKERISDLEEYIKRLEDRISKLEDK